MRLLIKAPMPSQAVAAAQAHGFAGCKWLNATKFCAEHHWVEADADWPLAGKWFAEHNEQPFPHGTLLFYTDARRTNP